MSSSTLAQWRQTGSQRTGTALRCNLALIAIAAASALIAGAAAAPAPELGLAVRPASVTDVLQCTLEPGKVESEPEYVTLAQFLSHRYRIGAGSARAVVRAAYDAGERVGVDPLLLLAVMAIESSFNPAGKSVAGAEGLMPIMPAQHLRELEIYGGEDAVRDPRINIALGAQILKRYIGRAGSVKAGLRMYNGVRLNRASRYPHKVIAERTRLQDVLREQRRPERVGAS